MDFGSNMKPFRDPQAWPSDKAHCPSDTVRLYGFPVYSIDKDEHSKDLRIDSEEPLLRTSLLRADRGPLPPAILLAVAPVLSPIVLSVQSVCSFFS
jgi:hypothetical protein